MKIPGRLRSLFETISGPKVERMGFRPLDFGLISQREVYVEVDLAE